MPRIFKGSESELRLLLSKSLEDLTDVSIILYTTDLQEAIEVIDGIAIEDNIATLNLAPRAFLGMEDGALNYIVKAKNDGQEYYMERQSNYVLKSISHINEDGVAAQTIEITKNGEYMITPNDGLYVNLNVAIEDDNGSFDDGYSIGQAEGYGTGYAVGYEAGQNEGVAEYVETLPIKEITENGEYREITKGVNVNVPNQTTKLEVTENGTYTPPIPFIGYDEVDVQVDIPEIQSDKTITLHAGETGTITPDQGYDAMDKVNYTCVAGASKTVLPNGLILSGSTFTEFDGSKYDVSERTDLSNFFENCEYVEAMDLSTWDVSEVRDMDSILANCKIDGLDLSSWDVGNVINMSRSFMGNQQIKGFENWNVGKVITMKEMFNTTTNTATFDLSKWDTSNVTNMESMFANAGSTTHIDMSGCDLGNVTTMANMFKNCRKLIEVKMGGPINSNVVVTNMFGTNTTVGTFYYNPNYDFSRIIAVLPTTWTAVPMN